MEIKLIVILAAISIVTISCNKYTKNQTCTKDSHGVEHCMKKDEYDETEFEDEEPEFYEEDDEDAAAADGRQKNKDKSSKEKKRLTQWDPVKVSSIHRELL